MGCSPGSPCNPSPLPMVYAAYPANCKDVPNGCCPTSKTLYDGPNLPNTGIENKDNVSVALDKIDDALDPTTIVQNFINIVSANPPLAVLFCDLVGDCPSGPTTSTTSTTSTTTITTTVCPQTYLYNYYTIEDGRNITPAGWHVPSIAEWNALLATQSNQTYDLIDPLGWLAENYWGDPNELTNATGLSLRKNNNRKENGLFYYDYYSLYWTTTDESPGLKYTAGVYGCCGGLYDDQPRGANSGLAIRLIKDNSTDTGTMIGNDGTVYPTVKIGTQVWMAQDLQETKYRNGDIIPVVTGDNAWAVLSTGARCLFLNQVCCSDPLPCIQYSIYGNESFSFEYNQCSDGSTQIYSGTDVYGDNLCAEWNSINVLTGIVSIGYNNRCGCNTDLG